NGIAHLSVDGAVLGYVSGLANKQLGAIAADSDGSIWAGHLYAGGIARFSGGGMSYFGFQALGNLANAPVTDIQLDKSGAQPRRMMVSFFGITGVPATIGVY